MGEQSGFELLTPYVGTYGREFKSTLLPHPVCEVRPNLENQQRSARVCAILIPPPEELLALSASRF
jgi:hypothetical protein